MQRLADLRLHAIVSDVHTARSAVEGGATVVQLRLKGASTETIVRAGAAFRQLAAMFVVNDDVEAALAIGADGVHLGASDSGARRALEAGLVLGLSASTPGDARDAERAGAHYLGCGPVWATPTKPDAGAPIGLAGLSRVCAGVRIPVVAIGGIDATNAGSCIEAGAAGVAVVRAALDARTLRAELDRALAQRESSALK